MKPIVEYLDYRKYIFDFYSEKKKESKFTWRKFAALAGYSSNSYLMLVCEGKTRLTSEGAVQVAIAMGLVGFKFHYFLLMVEYANAQKPSMKEKFFQEMVSLGMEHKVKIVNDGLNDFYKSWRNVALRELAPALPGSDVAEMGLQCIPEIDAESVSATLDFLVKNGLLIKDEKGCYHQTGKSVSTGNMDVVPETVRSLHHQMSDLAMDSMENLPLSERCISGLTVGITKKAYPKIIEELAKCRRRIVAIATDDDETEQVYRLNLHLFPLTKLIRK